MEIHQLRYFCAVARNGTFTRASEVEHVAQPSLSQQIRKLEAELGTRLFDRTPRSAKLTVFGRAFLPRAERILRELGEAKTEMQEMSGQEKGDVAVGIIPTVASYLLPRVLNGFSRRHPEVNVKVVEEITPVLLERLHQGTVDIAIVAVPVDGDEIASVELIEERFYAVLPASHPKAGRRALNLAELRGERFLLLKEGHCFRDSLIDACQESRVRPNVVFESGQFATILAMVSAGMGVSAVPAMAVQAQPGCRFIALTNKRSVRRIGLVRNRNRFETLAQRVLREHVVEMCRAIWQTKSVRKTAAAGSILIRQ